MAQVDGILFDLDGTLWDAVDGICTARNRGLERCGLPPALKAEEVRSCMGMLLEDIAARLMPDLPPERRSEVMAVCAQEQADYLARHGGTLYDGVEETLAVLRERCPLFIVSNCQSGYIEGFLAITGLGQYFTDFTCPGETGKPKGENIALLVERHQLKHPLYVGDTQGDYNAATAAGVPFLHAAYGFGTIDRDVPAVTVFSELPTALDRLTPP